MTTQELRDAITNKNVIIGTKRTIKYLKMKGVKLVILANNCPENIKSDIEQYAKLANVKVETFDGTGKQLGIFCGKPFLINTIAIKVKQ
jgi:large subunit ribosomal protein L30e